MNQIKKRLFIFKCISFLLLAFDWRIVILVKIFFKFFKYFWMKWQANLLVKCFTILLEKSLQQILPERWQRWLVCPPLSSESGSFSEDQFWQIQTGRSGTEDRCWQIGAAGFSATANSERSIRQLTLNSVSSFCSWLLSASADLVFQMILDSFLDLLYDISGIYQRFGKRSFQNMIQNL